MAYLGFNQAVRALLRLRVITLPVLLGREAASHTRQQPLHISDAFCHRSGRLAPQTRPSAPSLPIAQRKPGRESPKENTAMKLSCTRGQLRALILRAANDCRNGSYHLDPCLQAVPKSTTCVSSQLFTFARSRLACTLVSRPT